MLITNQDEFFDVDLQPEEKMGTYSGAQQYGDSFEKIEKRIAEGETPVYSRPYMLQIDLDTKEDLEIYKNRLQFFKSMFGYHEDFVIESPSGRGYHIYVHLTRDYSIPERIAMQLLLGSDPIREGLSIYKFTAGERIEPWEDDFKKNPTFLFEKDVNKLPCWTQPDYRSAPPDLTTSE